MSRETPVDVENRYFNLSAALLLTAACAAPGEVSKPSAKRASTPPTAMAIREVRVLPIQGHRLVVPFARNAACPKSAQRQHLVAKATVLRARHKNPLRRGSWRQSNPPEPDGLPPWSSEVFPPRRSGDHSN